MNNKNLKNKETNFLSILPISTETTDSTTNTTNTTTNFLPSLNIFLESSKAFAESLSAADKSVKSDINEDQMDGSLTPPFGESHSSDETESKKLRPKRGQYR